MRKMPYNLLSPGSAISISNQVGIGGALARFSRRSYAIDYIALATLVAAWVLVLIFVKPFYRMFYLDDRALQHPFAVVERVDVRTYCPVSVSVSISLNSIPLILFFFQSHPFYTLVSSRFSSSSYGLPWVALEAIKPR